MSSDGFQRTRMLQRLSTESFDVLVVGGGITGAGVALDAASRGLRTALVERDDFASGTSSKSSKLVHGGLRYLQQGEVALVYQALRERQRLRHNAPHLVKVLPFLLPALTEDSVISRRIARALRPTLWMYDLTGGWRIGKFHKRLDKEAAFAHLPTMPKKRLSFAFLYFDASVDDARLVLDVALTAADEGAVVANGCSVVELVKDDDGRVSGAVVDADGRSFTVAAKVVVNAAGVWSDQVRALDEGHDPASIRPAKGVHLTLPWAKVRNDVAVIIPVPKDKRSLFLVPWGSKPDGTFEHTYVGTTDTDYDGPLDDPQCTRDDIDYVLRAVNATITSGITAADVTGAWAGLRPLVSAPGSGAGSGSSRTADLSRRHTVNTAPSGVVTVTGGKLTTYRQMAEDTVDEVAKLLGRRTKCHTKRLRLIGAEGYRPATPGSPQAHLAERFGGLATQVWALIDSDPSLAQPLVPGLPELRAEAVYAARHEMARSLDDVLTRRTRLRLRDRQATLAAAPEIARLLATELGWDDAETERQVAHFTALCEAEIVAGLTSETHGASTP